jgi:hypothetical protein
MSGNGRRRLPSGARAFPARGWIGLALVAGAGQLGLDGLDRTGLLPQVGVQPVMDVGYREPAPPSHGASSLRGLFVISAPPVASKSQSPDQN